MKTLRGRVERLAFMVTPHPLKRFNLKLLTKEELKRYKIFALRYGKCSDISQMTDDELRFIVKIQHKSEHHESTTETT